ncbi:MAG: hypothetical protein ACREOI_10365 [bacterium]
MSIFKKFSHHLMLISAAGMMFVMSNGKTAHAQPAQEIRWLRVGNLHSWYSSLGSELEIGRTGQEREQTDGLRWPAQYVWQDNIAGKAMWIGTTNYFDRKLNSTIPHKVVAVGTRGADPAGEIMPVSFKMIGRFRAPTVIVDGDPATENRLNDIVDEVDETLKADRMIVNVMNTAIGLTVTRRLMAFSQQNHDNYFVYEYVLKNTGIVDTRGTIDPKTLTGVVLYFQYRYALGKESFFRGFAPSNNVDWGRNTVNQAVGTNPNAPGFEFRAQYSWYGRHSQSPVDDFGVPYHTLDGRLTSAKYVGTVTLHADKSPSDKNDNTSQPSTTWYIGSDTGPQTNNQFDPGQMTRKYEAMSRGHAPVTHADLVGENFADAVGNDAGGYAQGEGYGPYTLAPGDSVRIVLAEAVAGLSREKCIEIGKKWIDNTPPFIMPNGSTSTDRTQFKNAWVRSGVDSLYQTYRRAIQNFKSNYAIPAPPPPPSIFEVKSGGDRISLSWSNNAAAAAGFNGYKIYRAVGKPDTSYTEIFSCNRSNVVHAFDDTTARRGFDYFYYVVSKDDGSINGGAPLVSSKFYTMTNAPAFLRRPAADALAAIRVVPNPFNIRARQLQFGNEAPDRIAFFGLPPQCMIKIYTERGDLIETIEHTDGSGDELWDSLTSSRQIVVSGLYIAHFETPDGRTAFRKFIIIR